MSDETPQTPPQPALLVGIANPATMPDLIHLAVWVARSAGYRVAVTHVVLPAAGEEDLPDDDAAHVQAAEEFLGQARDLAANMGVAVSTFTTTARRIEDGLLLAAADQQADLVLVGYSDEIPGPDARERAFDKVMHRVARIARCDVVVAKMRGRDYKRVVVPLESDANLPVTGMLARALASQGGAQVKFMSIVEPGADPATEELRWQQILGRNGLGDFGELAILRTARPARTVIEQCGASDITIVGTPPHPTVPDAIFGTDAERIALQAASTVLLVHSGPGKAWRT